jgi:hypothetical protein
MIFGTIHLDPCICIQTYINAILILNPITKIPEYLYYPMTSDKILYYQSLVIYHYKSILNKILLINTQEIDESEIVGNEISELKRENIRLVHQAKDLKRHNKALRDSLIKMNSEFVVPKLERIIKPGTVIFPKGMEPDEDFEIEFGYEN